MKPSVYYYLWQAPGWQLWRMMFASQMLAFEESALLDASHFTLMVNGCKSDIVELTQDSVLGLYKYQKSIIRPIENHIENLYEGWPLRQMWLEARALTEKGEGDTPMLYVHSKGALTMNKCVLHWHKLMEWYNVYQWRGSVQALNMGFQTSGVLLTDTPQRHYSGNFWWAKAGYLATLPDPLSEGYYTDESRIKYEMWVGLNLERPFSHLNTGLNHYIDEYPPSRYK